MKTRFDELLPFYVNGTLAEAERTWVDSYLREHPAAAAELGWARSLQSRLLEDVPAVSSEVGLERAMARIQAEKPPAKRPRQAATLAAPKGLLARLGEWVSGILPQPVLRPAFVGALAVLAVQTVVIVHLVGEREDDSTQLRAIQGSVVEKGPYLKVNFKTDAREADIRMLLVEVHGSLAAGPGQLGDYYLRISAEQLASATSRLKQSPIVDEVATVDALPVWP